MKALSVKPKEIDKIEDGSKTIELRSWAIKHRGPLLLCATQPDGHAHCIVDVDDCRPFLPEDAPAACSDYRPGLFAWILKNRRPIPGGRFKVKGQLGLFNVELPTPPIV